MSVYKICEILGGVAYVLFFSCLAVWAVDRGRGK